MLLLLVGKAAKSCEKLMDEPKQYVTTVKLGANTETDDLDSAEMIVENLQSSRRASALKPLSRRWSALFLSARRRYCAVKIAGRRAYDLSGSGKPVDPAPRNVRIDAIEILSGSGRI